jgi:hypothetical protein
LILKKEKATWYNEAPQKTSFFTFHAVPKEKVAFIVATKVENGQPYLAIKKFITQNTKIELEFMPLSAAEIKEKLKDLDKL